MVMNEVLLVSEELGVWYIGGRAASVLWAKEDSSCVGSSGVLVFFTASPGLFPFSLYFLSLFFSLFPCLSF